MVTSSNTLLCILSIKIRSCFYKNSCDIKRDKKLSFNLKNILNTFFYQDHELTLGVEAMPSQRVFGLFATTHLESCHPDDIMTNQFLVGLFLLLG